MAFTFRAGVSPRFVEGLVRLGRIKNEWPEIGNYVPSPMDEISGRVREQNHSRIFEFP
jgi:hypothetical protein